MNQGNEKNPSPAEGRGAQCRLAPGFCKEYREKTDVNLFRLMVGKRDVIENMALSSQCADSLAAILATHSAQPTSFARNSESMWEILLKK